MDHDEMVRCFSSDPTSRSQEVRDQQEYADRLWQQQMDSGEWPETREGDNYPIGLDNNNEPFPVRKRADETSSDETSNQDRDA